MTRFLAALALLALLGGTDRAAAQTYPWPLAPTDEQRRVSGTFCEYRDTGSAPHFHNGADLPAPDGTPVYPVKDGRVTSLSAVGSNAYVRVEDMAYVHIVPAPGLAVGDAVGTGQTVLGTIVSGQGHVHLTDGYVGSERQPLRQGGGLDPYDDPWAPVISNVRFYAQPTRQRLATTELTGPVEITFRVEERNAAPGTSGSGLNNGAYEVGYQVFERDRTTLVHTPTADGFVFRFDAKPSNDYVHNVFDPIQATLSNHVYIPTNELTRASAWDTSALPEGDYSVLLLAGDTRGNVDSLFVDVSVSPRDILPPPPVTLREARATPAGEPFFAWSGGEADDLAGYRVYQSPDNTAYGLFLDEGALPPTVRAHTAVTTPEAAYYFIVAADTVAPANESAWSDRYGLAPDPFGRRVLIVDGFDRTQPSGSWNEPAHFFGYVHGRALAASGYGFSTVANEAVTAGDVSLADYDAVVWLLGDESTSDETFSTTEQARVRTYLEGGGRLLVTGSEMGWDLGARGSTADQAFLRDVLKVDYAGDDAGSYSVRASAGGPFEGVAAFSYGSYPYEEDYPDYFTPVGGSAAALTYANGRVAAAAYEGPVGGGMGSARVIVLGFPFETISGETAQDAVMSAAMDYLLPVSTDREAPEALPARLELGPAYPNPFHEAATVPFTLPAPARVQVTVYDLLGRRVATLVDAAYPAGTHRLTWRPRGQAGGVYLVRLITGDAVRQTRLVLVR